MRLALSPSLSHPSRTLLAAIGAPLLLLSSSLARAEQAAPAPGISTSSMIQGFLGLLVILALLALAAYLMRRLNGGRPFGGGPLKLIGGIAVGSRERIIVVEVADTWVVVGIAPGQMRTLHTLPKGELPAGAGPGMTPPFSHWLQQMMTRKNERS